VVGVTFPDSDGDESTPTMRVDAPYDPEDLLPEESVLSLGKYLDMHAAVGHRSRYEILYRLVHSGAMSPKKLETTTEIVDSTLHYHLNNLIDVGLFEKRQRTERGRDGLYTYYRTTVLGEVTLTEGPRIYTRFTNCAPEAIEIGQPVKATFETVSDEVTLPLFRPR
jgi:DNA-binding HxlR family transcriptional regulator